MIREFTFSLLTKPAEIFSGRAVSTETQRSRILVSIHPDRGRGVDVKDKRSEPLLNYLDVIATICFLGIPDCNWKQVKNGKSEAFARRIYLK